MTIPRHNSTATRPARRVAKRKNYEWSDTLARVDMFIRRSQFGSLLRKRKGAA